MRDAENQISSPQKQFWPRRNQQPSSSETLALGTARTPFPGMLTKGSQGDIKHGSACALPAETHQPYILLYHNTTETLMRLPLNKIDCCAQKVQQSSWMPHWRHQVDHRRHQVEPISGDGVVTTLLKPGCLRHARCRGRTACSCMVPASGQATKDP